MALAADEKKIRDIFFEEIYGRQNDSSFIKTFLKTLRSRVVGWRENSVTKFYKGLAASFLYYLTSRIPFQVPVLDLSSPLMAKGSEPEEDWTMNSVRLSLNVSRPQRTNSCLDNDGRETLLRYHTLQQDEISNHMLDMARNLKAQSIEANNIIKRDIKKLDQAKASAEGNIAALKTNSDQLGKHSRDHTNWCLIILVIVVLMIFINMVIFMKIMKKN